jgi:rubrerythrin
MTKYKCKNCSYTFLLKEGKRLPNKCPYCSKEGALEKLKSAQQLIDEITKEFSSEDRE